MAAIDKIYISDLKDRTEFLNWCKINREKCLNEIERDLLDYFYYLNEPDSFFENWLKERKEIPITNFSHEVDHWLIKNCDIPFIVNRLKDQYGEDYEILTNTSYKPIKYIYKKEELATKYKLINLNTGYRFGKKSNYKYFITILNNNYWFIDNIPVNRDIETGKCGDISSAIIECKSLKAVLRMIRKWGLPKGVVISITGRYVGEEWKVITK